jgi:DNA replicative helicase MCM subunit Mcm2 (Cdc46/Mcm family)
VLNRDKIVSVAFMKKYIHIAKCMKPTLTEEASEAIAEEYSRLRSQDTIDTDIARVCINSLGEMRIQIAVTRRTILLDKRV